MYFFETVAPEENNFKERGCNFLRVSDLVVRRMAAPVEEGKAGTAMLVGK